MPRISIYVPEKMKARMDEAVESANWSAIAQRAFELELSHSDLVKEVKSTTDVIERLRRSKQKKARELEKMGRECGVEWAKSRAEYHELKRIGEVTAELLADNPVSSAHGSAFCSAELIYMEVLPEEDRPDEYDLADFYGIDKDMVWDVVTSDFIAGFVEGAADVWNEVRGQI